MGRVAGAAHVTMPGSVSPAVASQATASAAAAPVVPAVAGAVAGVVGAAVRAVVVAGSGPASLTRDSTPSSIAWIAAMMPVASRYQSGSVGVAVDVRTGTHPRRVPVCPRFPDWRTRDTVPSGRVVPAAGRVTVPSAAARNHRPGHGWRGEPSAM